MINLIEDLSILTTIPSKNLNKLIPKILIVINDAVEEAMLEEKEVVEIDVGIGTLMIQVLDNKIKYKFIPNSKLESTVKNTVINKQNILESQLENALTSKLIETYKDFI